MRVKRIVKTADIIEKIKLGFGKAAYQGATPFMDSGDLWNFCMSTIKDPIKMLIYPTLLPTRILR